MIDTTTKQARRVFYNSNDWQLLRQTILERDNYECLWCKQEGRVTDRNSAILEVDHIMELEFHPELATDPDNLRTLCKDCHNKRHERFNYRPKNKEAKKWADEWFGT